MRHENEQNENKIKMNKIKKWKNKTKITEKIKLKKEIIYQFSVDDMYVCDYMKQGQKNPRNIVEAINVLQTQNISFMFEYERFIQKNNHH